MSPQSPAPLSGKQRRLLRSLGHHLEPVVQIGKEGLSTRVIEAVDEAVTHHELIKLRLGTECPVSRSEVADRLAEALSAHVAQILGRTILLYRRHPQQPVIELPESGGD